ncbi:phage tail protein [uncultured Amphritea sp.]|uniref:phage tail protein n=1 Tax=uncultured Amphritea sp. TaxID=981605 RepID=UPI0025F6BD88|nr:phage tail protein [uncultured Amphritea sp.]
MSAITLAGEALIAEKLLNASTLSVDTFILANIAGLDHTVAVDRSEAVPAAGDIVWQGAVTQSGYINPNLIVYSLMLGTDLGDFDFNWLGLYSSTDDVLVAVAYIPVQQKRKTSGVLTGNNLTRNFMLEFTAAQEITGINISADTWQIDFTARLNGIDERERLSNLDLFGAAVFFNSGFRVDPDVTSFQVMPGTGYVGGIRVTTGLYLFDENTLPTSVWLDVSRTGGPSSDLALDIQVVTAETLTDYTDVDGINHYVALLADIDAGGVITDRRHVLNGPMDTIISDLIAAHIAETDPHTQYLQNAVYKSRGLGRPFWHMGETSPVGAMAYNSQILARADYPELWAALTDPDNNFTLIDQADALTRPGCWHTGDGVTTFGAPAVLGDVIRVWDSSGVIDPARVLGSHQDDQSLHVDQFYTAGGGTGTGTGTIPEDGSWSPFLKSGRSVDGTDTAIKFKMNAAETRMKNTAWMLCFWYE